LDTTSERIVQEALDHVSKSRTTIAIAHRLSTIKNADKIVVMVQGEIVEQGTHEELIKMNQLYTKLVEAQEISHSEQTNVSEKDAITPAEKDRIEVNDDKSLPQNVNDVESLSGKQLSSFQVLLKIMELNKPELKYTIPGLVASIGSGLIYPFFALVFAEIIEAFSKRGDELKQAATFWSIIFLVIAACSFIFALLQNSLFGFASEHLTERLRSVTFTAILKQDIGFFDQEKNSTGALTSKLSSDAQTVQGVSGSTLGTILQLLTNIVGGILISFIYGWKLAAVATACLPVLLLTGVMRVKILTYFSDMSKDSYSKSSQVACESVAAIRTVQSHGRERDVYNKYSKILEGPYKLGIRSAFLNTQLYAFSQSSNFLVNALVFWYGGYLIAYEGYTIKQFFTVFVAIVFGSQGAGRIFAFAPDISKARAAAENIIQLIKSCPRIDSDSSSGEIIMNPQGRLVFENVKFSYPTRPEIPILKGLSFEVKPGTFIALVGASGCGKSTVINLVERFYDISEGRILFDGKNIKELHVSKYRYTLGLVSQEPNLFNMTIRQNIIFGLDYNPPDDDIIEAAKEANIHSFIMSLPDKYETSVGAKGSQLSGGQKQRIAIARALIKKPKLLLLDEATSALDAESEKVVQEALDNALRGRTTIAIAHKLSTIQKADVIYVLDEGDVKEQGTSSELFKQKGIYYQLAVQQNLKPQ
jgi:ATP-binding cassette subfamily B (MDR/TAP) protein 1